MPVRAHRSTERFGSEHRAGHTRARGATMFAGEHLSPNFGPLCLRACLIPHTVWQLIVFEIWSDSNQLRGADEQILRPSLDFVHLVALCVHLECNKCF